MADEQMPGVRGDVPPVPHQFGPRDVLQFSYLAAAVLLVGLLGLMAFATVFNRGTILAWLFVAGAFAFRHGFVEYRSRLAVSGTATATAHSAAIGLAELCGRARGGTVRDAPVTGTPCLFWKVQIYQWQARSKHRGWRRKLRLSHQTDTLALEDDTGRILVWTRGAEFIPVKRIWRSQDGNPPDAALRLVAAAGLQWPPPSSRYPMKITEERIERDGPLYVMGTLSERRQLPAAPPGVVSALLHRWATLSPHLDDRSFAAALRFATEAGERWLARDLEPVSPSWSPPQIDAHEVLVWKGDARRAFIIAGVLERDVLTALSQRAWLSLLGGAALMAGALLVAVAKFTHQMR